MSIDENIQESIMEISGCEENLSEKYDKMRKEKMESMYNKKFCDMLFSYLIFYRIFMK